MVAGSSPATPTKSDILKIEGHLIAPPLAEQKTERSGGQKGRGLGGSLPTSRQGIFARPCLEPVRLWRIPILPSPPNFVFRFAKCAAKKKDVVLAPPTHTRLPAVALAKEGATLRNSLDFC